MSGWNCKKKVLQKDFVTAYDIINFVDGDGTTVSVTNTDGKTSEIKYSVNTGNGYKKIRLEILSLLNRQIIL